jgi:phage gpG-like protein
VSVHVTHGFDRWKTAFKGQLTQLYLFVAAQMQTNRGWLFISEGAYNGHEKWAPLKLRAGKILRDKGTLMNSMGPMKMSGKGIRPLYGQGTIVRYGADRVTIGTSLAKARLLNDGGVITPKKGKLLWIPLPKGKSQNEQVKLAKKKAGRKGRGSLGTLRGGGWSSEGGAPIVRLKNGKWFMLAKKVTIPARPFDTWTKEDEDELKSALTEEVARVLRRK